MKRVALFAVVATLICLTAFGVFATGDGDKKASDSHNEINWVPYDEGLTLAKEQDKHIFIDFTTAWCGWCKKMDKETFSQPDVIELVNDNFIPVQIIGDSKKILDIDGYKVTEKNLTQKEFGVSGFPSFWFLESDGSKIGMIRGYKPKAQMVEALNFVKDRMYDTTGSGGEKK